MKLQELVERKRGGRAATVKHDQYYLLPDRMQWFTDWVKSQDFFPSVARKIDPCAGDGAICQYFPDIEQGLATLTNLNSSNKWKKS